MLDLTHQEAATIWMIARENNVADALAVICGRNNLSPEMITKMANAYVQGMNKLVEYMKEGRDTRVLLRVIDGGKHINDDEP